VKLIMASLLALIIPGLAIAQSQTPAQSSPAAPAGGAAAQAAPAPSPETHSVDWAPRQYVEMWNTGNISTDLQNTIFNSTTVMHARGERIPLTPTMVSGVISAWRKSMPDLHFNIEDTIIGGDKVVLRLSFTGTYTKVLFPNTADPADFNPPRKVRSIEVLIFRVKDGKIQELWEEYNEIMMRFAMGDRWCVADKPVGAKAPSAQPLRQPSMPPSTP
jgi:hypothetical protein